MGRSYFSSYWELKFNVMTDIFSLFKLWRQGAFIVIVIYLKYLQGFQERTSLSIIFFYVSQKKKSDIFWVLIGVTFPVVIPRKAAFHEPNAPSFHFVLLFYGRGWWWKGINDAFLHVWFNLKAWKQTSCLTSMLLIIKCMQWKSLTYLGSLEASFLVPVFL